MPYPNFHACRIRDPGDFVQDSFRTISREHEGKSYSIIVGKLKEGGSMVEQTYRYPKESWTESEARSHCKSHDGKLFEPASSEKQSKYKLSTDVEVNRHYSVNVRVLDGKKHLVVPVVMMTEGVHVGSHGAIYHPANELSKFASAWNGIPITIGHPLTRTGSANDPEILESSVVGRVFNVAFKDGALRGEAWIDEEKILKVNRDVLMAIKQLKPLEVSVGVWADEEPIHGIWGTESYEAIAKNYRPDHLAILFDEKGACSWEDGCGIRLNKKGGEDKMPEYVLENALSYKGTESTSWDAPTLADFDVSSSRWEELSQSERAKVASCFLIGSANAETFGDLKLPVVNPKTGKLNERALRAVISGRGAQVKGVSEDELKRARRKAYELLNKEFDAGLEIPDNLSRNEEKGELKMNEKGCCPEKIDLIVQADVGFGESDREVLSSMEEKIVNKLVGLVERVMKAESEVSKLQKNAETKKMEVEKELEELKKKLSDPSAIMNSLPVEVQEQINYGVKLYKEQRQKMIDLLLNEARDVYTKEELESKPMIELEKLTRLIKPSGNFLGMWSGSKPLKADSVSKAEKLLPLFLVSKK